MRFKEVFAVFIFIILGNISQSFAQDSNTVYYRIYMEKKVSSYYTAKEKISTGIFKEGSGFLIPEAELPDSYPADFTMFQDLYNALVGGYFSIDYGAIDKDLILELFIRNLDPETGKYKPQGEDGDTLFAYFEIRIGELPDDTYDPDDPNVFSTLPDSSFFPVDSSYYFNEGKYARLTLPKSDYFMNFLDSIGIARDDTLSFAYMQYDDWDTNGTKTNDWNGNGIEITDTPDSITFKAIHLSKVGGGRGRIHKRRFEDPTGIEENYGVPIEFNLEQNYPNPFNPETKIRYTINNSQNNVSFVQLDVYNILGKKVRTLVSKKQRSGNYEVLFDASNLASGMYIYTLRNNNLLQTRKMILMK
jgi:hypothetical protein